MRILCVHGHGVNSSVSHILLREAKEARNDLSTYHYPGHQSTNRYVDISGSSTPQDKEASSNKNNFFDNISFVTAPLRQELRQITGDNGLLDYKYLQGSLETIPYPGM